MIDIKDRPRSRPLWKFLACPRCEGDMYLDWDNHYYCILCARPDYPTIKPLPLVDVRRLHNGYHWPANRSF